MAPTVIESSYIALAISAEKCITVTADGGDCIGNLKFTEDVKSEIFYGILPGLRIYSLC